MNRQSIGMFDSGIGGTSIWKETAKVLPNEDIIYLADSAHAPYGEKTKNRILDLCIKNTEFLLEKGCKIIVVACNTATTNAIKELRASYDVPFIGIEPAIKPAALNSISKKIGILATKGTLSSSLFHSTAKIHASGMKIIEREATDLVPLIEAGKINTTETKKLLKSYLQPMIQEGIDHLVLGCTHFPYLIPLIQDIIPGTVKIIDSGEAVARQTLSVLSSSDLRNERSHKGTHQFFINTDPSVLQNILKNTEIFAEVSELQF